MSDHVPFDPSHLVGPITGQHQLAEIRGRLDSKRLDHLQRLMGSWNLLADFCFSDLLLMVPTDERATSFRVLGQVRPSTSQTLYRTDMIGQETDEVERPLVSRSFRLGEIIEGEITIGVVHEQVRVLCIPVRFEGEVIAVLSRESVPSVGRQTGELERVYMEVFNRFARMISLGEFPFPSVESESDEAPRVGDGVLLLDRSARVEWASPNAVSALHRVGVHANSEGLRLGELGLDDEPVRDAFAVALPTTVEVERGSEVTVLVRVIPLLDRGKVTGAVVLVRDISELRRRDRLLLSKDATIREIHHRVKNNLQTISSLLRLQGRRLASEEAKGAIEESVRRIHSIALVHESLAREAGDDVPFSDILRPLIRMVEESLVGTDRDVTVAVEGDVGSLPAEVATPMAVVLNELLQNAVDHAFPRGTRGHVRVVVDHQDGELVVSVIDDGVGLPEGFTIDRSTGLGLSIVRALVTSDLGGTIAMLQPVGGGHGTVVEVRIDDPADTRHGPVKSSVSSGSGSGRPAPTPG